MVDEDRNYRKGWFDFTVSNPPYQLSKETSNYAPSIYPNFMVAANSVSRKTVMIHPLKGFKHSNKNPSMEQQIILNNPHMFVVFEEPDAARIFPDTDIKGGVIITLYNESDVNPEPVFQNVGLVPQAQQILKKVVHTPGFVGFDTIISSPGVFKYSPEIVLTHPEIKPFAPLETNVFKSLPDVFTVNRPPTGKGYQILGLLNLKRQTRWVREELIEPGRINVWKVLIPESNGNGRLGEPLSTPVIAPPGFGSTKTFIAVGEYAGPSGEQEAEATLKYVKTRFARLLLGTKKITQHNPPRIWSNVPLQEFDQTRSDIQWNTTIAEIDKQLYKKYGFTSEEIRWVETNISPMV